MWPRPGIVTQFLLIHGQLIAFNAIIKLSAIKPLCAKLFNKNMHLQISLFIHTDMTQIKSFFVQDKDLPSLHTQYHGYWWPCDAGILGISNHDIDVVQPG